MRHGRHPVNVQQVNKETTMIGKHELSYILLRVGMIGMLLSITRIIMKIGRKK
jgi:hypothetical protein